MTTNFFTAANSKYYPFVLPYIVSSMFFNDGSRSEIVLEDVEAFRSDNTDALDVIDRHFPNLVTIRPGDFSRSVAHSVKFTEQPSQRSDYVYIGDIDILMLESIVPHHLARMISTGLPYSNVVRPGKSRLTGLHFTAYDAYYPVPEIADRKLFNLDEALLYALVIARGHSLPPEDGFVRQQHGFHLSPSRLPSGWGIIPRYFDAYRQLLSSPVWAETYPLFDIRYRRILSIVDALVKSKLPEGVPHTAVELPVDLMF